MRSSSRCKFKAKIRKFRVDELYLSTRALTTWRSAVVAMETDVRVTTIKLRGSTDDDTPARPRNEFERILQVNLSDSPSRRLGGQKNCGK